MRPHLKDPAHPYDLVVAYRHKDGSDVWVGCRGIAIRGEDGRARRMLGVHSDLTEQKRTEQKLERRNREFREFAIFLSHEIPRPVAACRPQRRGPPDAAESRRATAAEAAAGGGRGRDVEAGRQQREAGSDRRRYRWQSARAQG